MSYLIEMVLIAFGLSLVTSLVQRKIIDQDKAEKLKNKMKKLRKDVTSSIKNKKKMGKVQKKLMSLQTRYLKMTMKASLPTMAIFILAYWLMGKRYTGYSVAIPFEIPFIGSQLGWIWVFIIFSLIASLIFRKLLKIRS